VPARVPGSVLADLLAAGLVPDPYVGTQSLLSEWVPQRTWVYRRRLRVTTPAERTFLQFDGIDHAAAIYLDGKRIARHEGMFVPLVVEVTPAVACRD
jgi:beta-mannosidase